MNLEKFDLSILRIASPCSVGWDNMRGDDRKRFCGQCELNVYNVAGMTVAEVRELVSTTEGRLCMRLHRRADGTVITKDCPVGLRTYQKRVARFAGATIAAILGLFSISFGQKEDKNTIDASKIKIVRTTNCNAKAELSGTVVDPNGAVIPGARIRLFNKKDEKASVLSDANGFYRFLVIPPGDYTLRVSVPGFKPIRIERVKVGSGECLELNLEMKIDGDSVEVGIFVSDDFQQLETTSSSISTTITLRKIQNLPF